MRYILFDFMPLVYKYSVVEPTMKHTRRIMTAAGEVPQEFNTTLPTMIIKHIYRNSNFGEYAVGVCLEGGSTFRKQHFANSMVLNDGAAETLEYKGGRRPLGGYLKDGADLTINMLVNGGVSCFRKAGYEADDFIYTLVCELKEKGITDPIDIITVDRDLLPLVDEQVSVYIASNRQFSDISSPELQHYFQVTPRSMEQFCALSSTYKGYKLPYNSIMLFKMIKGDNSDNIPMAVKGYGAKKFSALVDSMIRDGVQFEKAFRYGKDFNTEIAPILVKYFKETELNRIAEVYTGLNLRRVVPDNQAHITVMPTRIDYFRLQTELDKYAIQLPEKRNYV